MQGDARVTCRVLAAGWGYSEPEALQRVFAEAACREVGQDAALAALLLAGWQASPPDGERENWVFRSSGRLAHYFRTPAAGACRLLPASPDEAGAEAWFRSLGWDVERGRLREGRVLISRARASWPPWAADWLLLVADADGRLHEGAFASCLAAQALLRGMAMARRHGNGALLRDNSPRARFGI